jgi:hypothetical protein
MMTMMMMMMMIESVCVGRCRTINDVQAMLTAVGALRSVPPKLWCASLQGVTTQIITDVKIAGFVTL